MVTHVFLFVLDARIPRCHEVSAGNDLHVNVSAYRYSHRGLAEQAHNILPPPAKSMRERTVDVNAVEASGHYVYHLL
jgi:hypothetical protein